MQIISRFTFKAQVSPTRMTSDLYSAFPLGYLLTDIPASTCITQNSQNLPSIWVGRNYVLSVLKPKTLGYHQIYQEISKFIFGNRTLLITSTSAASILSLLLSISLIYPCLLFSIQQPEWSLENLIQIMPFLCLNFSSGFPFILK